MARERPTVVTVLGILNLVLGVMYLLNWLVELITVVLIPVLARSEDFAVWSEEQLAYVNRHAPGWLAGGIGLGGAGVLLALALMLSGVGLLRSRPWGRRLALACALAVLVLEPANTVFELAYVRPAAARWEREQEEGEPPAPVVAGVDAINLGQILLYAGCAAIAVAYAVVLLVLLTRPGVVAFFSETAAGPAEPDPGEASPSADGND